MKVLLVDDDRDLVEALEYTLARDGYEVLAAFDGKAGLKKASEQTPDLMVLDLMMPGLSGMEVLSELRSAGSRLPIIVLTALSDEDHVVEAFKLGADDYMVKPFRPRELIARIQALLRRSQGQADQQGSRALALRDVTLDPDSAEVTVGGKAVHLTRTEFNLLHYLMLNRDRVMRSADLISGVWGWDAEENDDMVKVVVSRLRRKIEPDPSQPRYIINVPGMGYKFQSKET